MNYLERLRDVRTFIFDVDGVLTDGNLLLLDNGKQIRKMHIRDGYAIRHALREGYQVAVISGGYSEGVADRIEYLGVEHIFLGVEDKVEVFDDFIEQFNIDPGEVLYMGDDLPDYHLLRLVGMPTCPSDAVPEVMELAQYISPKKGGEGCVRDVIEKVMRLQGKWLPWQKDVSAEHSSDSN